MPLERNKINGEDEPPWMKTMAGRYSFSRPPTEGTNGYTVHFRGDFGVALQFQNDVVGLKTNFDRRLRMQGVCSMHATMPMAALETNKINSRSLTL
jgi:hypothetical protein